MPLPPAIVAALASAAARRRRFEGDIVTAVGTTWKAALVSDQRGPLLTRKAAKAEAYAQAHLLLDQAEDQTWYRGEAVSVRIEQAEGYSMSRPE